MNEQVKMGINRTGVQMSPIDSSAMTAATSDMMAGAPDIPDTSPMDELRAAYVAGSDQLGSVPVPGTLKGVLSTAATLITGNTPQLLIDKLGERLAFERTGTRIYDALIAKVQARHGNGASTPPLEKLAQIREQEAEHFTMVAEAISGLGADPTAQTPCADLAGVESSGIMAAVMDPRTTIAQSLHAVLIAEMADNNGWDMLIALAEDQHHDTMAAGFAIAREHERAHLLQVQAWYEEAMLGAPMPHKAASPDTDATLLH